MRIRHRSAHRKSLRIFKSNVPIGEDGIVLTVIDDVVSVISVTLLVDAIGSDVVSIDNDVVAFVADVVAVAKQLHSSVIQYDNY